MPFCLFIAMLLAVGDLPAWAQSRSPDSYPDGGGAAPPQRRRYVPPVNANRRQEADEDHTRDPSQQTAIALTEALGDSLNNSFFPKNEIQGDLEWFIKRLDKELERFSDMPRYDILQNAQQTERLGGDGYRDLVEKALKPLAGQAGPDIDKLLVKLRAMIDQLGEARRDIDPVADQIEQAVRPLRDDPPTGNGGQTVDGQRLQRTQQQAARIRDMIESLREQIKQADRKVDRAKMGVEQARSMKDQLKGSSPGSTREAYRLDEIAIRGATQNKASGRSNTDSVAGLSGPVVEKIAQRMEAAVDLVEKAQEAAKKVSDEDPQKGLLMKLAEAAQKAANAEEKAAESGQKGAQEATQKGQQLTRLEQRFQQGDPTARDEAREPYAQVRDANQRAQDDRRDAAQAVEAVERQIAQAEKQWEDVKDKLIGRLDGGESELNGRLPVPLPPTYIRAAQPKKPQDLKAGRNQDQIQRAVRSRPMRYPDSLGRDANAIIRGEFGSGGNLSQ